MIDTQKIRRKESKHTTTEFIKSQREGEKEGTGELQNRRIIRQLTKWQ